MCIRDSSHYRWAGRVESRDEVVVLFKTVPKRVGSLFRYLRAEHPYDVPELVELDVPRVDPPYLAWLLEATSPPEPGRGTSTRRAGRPVRGVPNPERTPEPPRRR